MTILDDRSLHDPAGTRAQVATLFAPESVLAEIVRIESVLAGVQAGLGIIPNEAASAIQAGAAGWRPDPEAVMRHRAQVEPRPEPHHREREQPLGQSTALCLPRVQAEERGRESPRGNEAARDRVGVVVVHRTEPIEVGDLSWGSAGLRR